MHVSSQSENKPLSSAPTADSATELRMVWIVDDSPLQAEMARNALTPAFATRTFSDGPTFLEHLTTAQPPDVLLLDWVMPGLSGLEVCKFLRSQESTRELSILLLTVQDQTAQIVEGLAAGANDYLKKPYSPAELYARVGSLIRASRLRERAEGVERSMRALLAHLPEALITTRLDGEILFLNAEAQQLLGPDAKSVKGRAVSDFFPALGKMHEARLDEESPATFPDFEGGGRIYEPAVRRLELEGVPALAVTLRDVTEKRRLALRRLDFYSMVAHDLRSPLTAMSLRVQSMRAQRHGPLAECYRGDLGIVEARITELVHLINDFLDLARADGVGLGLETEAVDLAALVRTHLETSRSLSDAEGIEILFDEPQNPISLLADPARLTRVISTLVSNALKASPQGSQVRIEIADRGTEIELAVSDAGGGIAEEKLPELFERQAGPAVDAPFPGTGLALLIVREIVEAHAGTCGVQSTLGKGSRFWFRLPSPQAVGPSRATFA